jgi:hypothetical protein
MGSALKADIPLVRKSDKFSVFLGGSCKDNSWRGELKKTYSKDVLFLDPFDTEWEPEENIYDEVTGMLLADYVIFYQGGEGSKKEQELLSNINKAFFVFDDWGNLRDFFERFVIKSTQSVADALRKTASIIEGTFKKEI